MVFFADRFEPVLDMCRDRCSSEQARKVRRTIRIAGAICLLISTVPVAACSMPGDVSRVIQIRDVCESMGLPSSEAPFSACVYSLEQTAPMKTAALGSNRGVPYVVPDDEGSADRKRIERACFDVGLDPRGWSYWNCVDNLDRTLFDISMVGGTR
jgi:hypothetical protein